jgi:hypothetical protein
MNKLWKLLSEKGKIATLIGFFFAAPANVWAIWNLYKSIIVTIDQLWVVVIINSISIVWFILPSEISIKSGKGLEIIIKD